MKTKYRLIFLLTVLGLLNSCTRDEPYADSSNPVAVQFTSDITATPQSRVSGSLWDDNDEVGIFMVKHGQSLNINTIVEGADNRFYRTNAGGNFSPATIDQAVYFPQNGDKVDFISYYPYKTPLSNYVYQVNTTNQSNPALLDLLYAFGNNSAAGYDKNNSTVALTFKHKMSQFTINTSAGAGLTSAQLAGMSVSIQGLNTTAGLNLTNGNFENPGNPASVTPQMITAGQKYEAILIPQSNIAGSKVSFTVSGLGTFDWDISDKTFASGKHYTYTVTISKTGITVSPCTITDWNQEPVVEGGFGFQVGDYYPDPTNKNTAIGVVCWIDPNDSRHGRVMGLHENSAAKWGPIIDEIAAGVGGLSDIYNGAPGTRNLIDKRKSEANFSTNYPHFYWVYHTMNNGDINGKWYLPGYLEFQEYIYPSFTPTINSTLTAAGGTPIDTNGSYWTLNEFLYSQSAYFRWSDGEPYSTNKSNNHKARCIMAF